jgi:peptidoglycan/LPS O-acetylase OafA/YrhL
MSLESAASTAFFRRREVRPGASDTRSPPPAGFSHQGCREARTSPIARAETRHHALDLLRGLAAVGIAVYHFLASEGAAIQSLGTFGVYVFFILSGLTMMLVYADRFSDVIARDDVLVFFWNRISRILPLLAAASLVGLVLAVPAIGWNRHLAARALQSVLTGTGLFALHLPGYLSTVTGAWSLGIEIVFYLFFPLVCLLTARARIAPLLIATLGMVIAQQIVLAILQHWAREDFTRFWHYYTTPLVFAPFFMLGIAIFHIRFGKCRANLPVSLVCAAGIATFSIFLTADIFETHWAYLVLSAFAFAAVFFAYHAYTPQFLIPVAAFLGNASYAHYLTHPFCISASSTLSDALGLGKGLEAAMFFALSLGVAHCSFAFFEKPARGYLRTRFNRRAIAGAAITGVSPRTAGARRDAAAL